MAWQPEHSQIMKISGARLNEQVSAFPQYAPEGTFFPPEGTKAHTSLDALTSLGDVIRSKARRFL